MSCPGGVNTDGFSNLDEKLSWVSTLRGRLGWAQEGWLFYVTGGGAWAKVDTDLSFNCPAGCGPIGGATTGAASFSDTKGGWAAGAGIEVRLIGNWTGRVEYLHIDVGSVSHTVIGAPTATFVTFDNKIQDNIFRAGLNYKFDWIWPR
jgi:outer membrane immunogenic protein